jgi:hypothetical protein
VNPKLWIYQGDHGRWFGHVDFHDGGRMKREGPFDSEAIAGVVISRMSGMQPPDDLLAQYNKEKGRSDEC